MTALSAALLCLPTASTIAALALLMLVAGMTLTPVLISGFGYVERLVPPPRLTEGLTWAGTGLSLAFALSIAAAGRVIDRYGAQTSFGITAVSGVVALLTLLAGYRYLRRADQSAAPIANLSRVDPPTSTDPVRP